MKRFLLAAVAVTFSAGAALAQVTLPQLPQIGANDLIPDIANGVPQAQSQYVAAPLLGNYPGTLPSNNMDNAIIGGDATTNLWQRLLKKDGTYSPGASVTTTVTYGGPDRWAYWSGASTAMTISQGVTVGTQVPTAYGRSFKMQRTSSQTGVVQMCMAQVVEGVNSWQFQNSTMELDFHVIAGSDFSGTGVTAYVETGAVVDEGISAFAFDINGGGGGGSGWTGKNNVISQTIPLSANGAGRFSFAGVAPTLVKEVGVAICYTPTGTAATNDFLAIAGVELTRNSGLTSVATGNAHGIALNVNDPRAKGFARRSAGDEAILQYRYFYGVVENSSTIAWRAPCSGVTTSIDACSITFPVPMRVAPTMTYTAGFAATTTNGQSAITACTSLATYSTLTGAAASPNGVLVTCGTSAGTPAAGVPGNLFDLGTSSASGQINASAEL